MKTISTKLIDYTPFKSVEFESLFTKGKNINTWYFGLLPYLLVQRDDVFADEARFSLIFGWMFFKFEITFIPKKTAKQ